MNDKQSIIFSKIKDEIISTYPQCHSIYLFGSWATEDETELSDLDIAVLLPRHINEIKCNEKLALSVRLAVIARVEKVDIIDIRQVDTIFQMQIINTGRRYDIDDGNEASLFEMTNLSRYQKLNDERDVILQEGIKQGRFYHV
jgi:predicted nucleotidyltransferase